MLHFGSVAADVLSAFRHATAVHSPDRPISAPLDRGAVRRVFHDGVEWQVWEGRLGTYDRRSSTHLFFECATAVRRVRDFPADWRSLPDDVLMRVAEGR